MIEQQPTINEQEAEPTLEQLREAYEQTWPAVEQGSRDPRPNSGSLGGSQ